MVRRLVALLTSLIFLHAMTAFACETVTAQQVADALNNAQGLQSGLKSCSMAAMAMIELGGNTCAHNACCVGILQLNLGPDWARMEPRNNRCLPERRPPDTSRRLGPNREFQHEQLGLSDPSRVLQRQFADRWLRGHRRHARGLRAVRSRRLQSQRPIAAIDRWMWLIHRWRRPYRRPDGLQLGPTC